MARALYLWSAIADNTVPADHNGKLDRKVRRMYPGSDPEHLVAAVLRRQQEVRAEARRGAEIRHASRSFRGWSPRAFRLWRLHVMVCLEDTRRA